ncbi:MAG: hypothetical protein ACOY4I_11685 [Bacillota bacterium]
MNSLMKLIRRFADRFMDYANVGFRYIDAPRYNEKLYSIENEVSSGKKRKTA